MAEQDRPPARVRTVEEYWYLPPGPGLHRTCLRRWAPDGTVDILSEDTLIVAELSESDARRAAEFLARPTAGPGLPPAHRPPEQLVEFVAWKLQISIDSFYGKVLLLVAHADPANRGALRQAFPVIVEAWEAWQDADGDFELPPAAARFLKGGHVR